MAELDAQAENLGFDIELSEQGLSGHSRWTEAVWAVFWQELVAPSELGRPAALGVPAGLEARHAAEWWAESCRRQAGAAAVVFADGAALSYGGMLEQAGRLAAALAGLGVGAGEVVAVDAARHLGLPVWILGIWLAGATYLALGSRDAWERKRRVAELGGARCVLGDGEGAAAAVANWGLPALDVTALRRLVADVAAVERGNVHSERL